MTLLTVAEILSGEALVSPSGPIDAVTAANTTDAHVWGSSVVAELKAVRVAPQAIAVAPQTRAEAGIAL